MATTGKSAALAVGGIGAAAAIEVMAAGVNASFTGGDALAADLVDTLAADAADTLAVDLGQGISFTGKTAAQEA